MDIEIQRLLSRSDDLLHRSRALAKEIETFSESLHATLIRYAERQHQLQASEREQSYDVARASHVPWR